MSTSFCPKCGKETDIFIESICQECFTGHRTLIVCPDVIYSRICRTCGSVFKKGKWIARKDIEKTIMESTMDSIVRDNDAHDLELRLMPQQLDHSRYRVHINATAKIRDVPMEADIETEMRINWETCDICSRISGGYFEGIVQIRGDNRIPIAQELEKCTEIARSIAASSQEKGDRMAFISQTLELNEGIDIYVGSMKLGKQICRAIIDVFGGKFLESPKLVGQKNGIDLYRITFALRLPEFTRGDIISIGDKVIEVQNCGKHISGIDLETGKRYIENFNDLIDVKKLGRISDAVGAVLIADEGRTVQVLDPETYAAVTIKKPEFLYTAPGNEVNIIRTAKGIYIIP